MNIANFSPIHSSQSIQGLQRAPIGQGTIGQGTTEPVRQSALKDTASFSEEALRLGEGVQTNTGSTKIRFDLVNRVKAEIAAGTYDTPDKMDIALDRMVSRIF